MPTLTQYSSAYFKDTTYTTPEKVVSLLRLTDEDGLRKQLSSTTDPTYEEVEMYINWAEEYIDKMTNHAWKERRITDRLYSIPVPFSGIYPRHVRLPLLYRAIRKVEHIYVFNGTGEVDWAASKVEGRANDWYVDKIHGMLFLKWAYPWYVGDNALRLTFTYGEAAVPKDIEEACTKLAATKILENDFSRVVLPDGVEQNPSRSMLINNWKADAELILRRRMSYQVIGIL
jgi:hypothetical protein